MKNEEVKMGTYLFMVQGSEVEPYSVQFAVKNGVFSATCTCRAGSFSAFCKHRLRIVQGSIEGIVSNNKMDVSVVAALPESAEYLAAYNTHEEKQKDHAKHAKELEKTFHEYRDLFAEYYKEEMTTRREKKLLETVQKINNAIVEWDKTREHSSDPQEH